MKKVVDKLNKVIISLAIENESTNTNFNKVKFAYGNYTTDLFSYLKNIAPLGKVCFLHTKNSFDRLGLALNQLFQNNSLQSVSIVCDEQFRDSLSCYSNTFNLGDDVRIVVACDYSLCNCALYLSSIKRLACVLLVDNFPCTSLLSPYVLVENDCNTDRVEINCSRHVYLTDNFDNFNNLSSCYAYVLSYLTSLLDYRVWQIYSSESLSKKAYNLLREAVYSTYNIMENSLSMQSKTLLTSYFQLEIANLLANGVLMENSASQHVALLYQPLREESPKIAFLGMLCILQIYELFLSNKKVKIFQVPNLVERATLISEICNVDKSKILRNLLNQSELIKSSNVNTERVLENLLKEVSSLVECVNYMRNTFIALGGKTCLDKSKFNKAVKLSGDINGFVNGMSLVREHGLSEFIN